MLVSSSEAFQLASVAGTPQRLCSHRPLVARLPYVLRYNGGVFRKDKCIKPPHHLQISAPPTKPSPHFHPLVLHRGFKKVSHLSLDDVGVDLGDSVDGVRSHDAQVRHVDPLAPVLLDQGHLPQLVHVVWVEGSDFLQRQKRRCSDSARPKLTASACSCVARLVR